MPPTMLLRSSKRMSRSNTYKNAFVAVLPEKKNLLKMKKKFVSLPLSFVTLDVVRIIWLWVNCFELNIFFSGLILINCYY